MRIRMHLVALVAFAAIAGCGGGDATSPGNNNNNNNNNNTTVTHTGAATADVTVYNDYYSPQSLTVSVGTAVTWTWASQGTVHTVTFDDNVTSDQMGSGSFTRTFTAAGTYPYHCIVHGTVMSGTVIVQ